MNNPPLCAIDEEDVQEEKKDTNGKKKKLTRIDSDLLVDRYHSTQKFNREILLQNISDDDEPQSSYSPNTNWQEDNDDEDEDW